MDRTGLARALQNAMQQKIGLGASIGDMVGFIEKFEDQVKHMDEIFQNEGIEGLDRREEEFGEVREFQAMAFIVI